MLEDLRLVRAGDREFRDDRLAGVDDLLAMLRDDLAALATPFALLKMPTDIFPEINIPVITAVEGQPKHLDMKLSRAKLGELTAELLERIVSPVKQAISDAGVALGQAVDGMRTSIESHRNQAKQAAAAKLAPGERAHQLEMRGTRLVQPRQEARDDARAKLGILSRKRVRTFWA